MDDQSVQPNLPFRFRNMPPDSQVREDNWKAVEAGIRGRQEAAPSGKRRPVRVALFLAVLGALAWGYWYFIWCGSGGGMEELKTGYGEVKNILLPDSSRIVLNAHSSMRMLQRSAKEGVAEVWLEGEAYFQVRGRLASRPKFVVHTRQVDVEVLGTKFNINTRRDHAVVALEEGKVQLTVAGEKSSGPGSDKMVLRPGQVAEVDSISKVKLGNCQQVCMHSGWSRNEFHFDQTSLADIARMIEETYGYEMEAVDRSVFQKNLSGDLRASNLRELVNVLEVALKLPMQIGNRKIYVLQP